MRVRSLSLITVAGVLGVGCSSSPGGGPPASDAAADAASTPDAGQAAGDSAAAPAPEAGGSIDAASPPQEAAVEAGSPEGGADGSVDIAHAPECTAYCAKVTACGATCDPVSDCAVPPGSCDQAHRAYIGCEAAKGTFSCGTGGFAVISQCNEDTSVCPAPAQVDAGSCQVTPPDPACLACQKSQCSSDYTTLYSDSELPAFTACVASCEMACNPPTVCPPMCADSVAAFSEWNNLFYCANGACPTVCTTTTVTF